MNDLKTIRQLIKLMVDNDLTEIDLESEGEKIKLKRGGAMPLATGGVHYLPAPAGHTQGQPGSGSVTAGGGGGGTPAHDDDELEDGLVEIPSPMVGTFYTSSNPDTPAFANAGDTIKADSVVCIIEAMKVFNEIKAEVAGTVVEVLVKNGQAVEFGQTLFRVRP